MRSHATTELEVRAGEALRATLEQVSTIKLRNLRRAPRAGGRHGMVAHIEVLGHSHTLACKVEASGELGSVGTALTELHADAAHLGADTTPVLIAPYLPPEAQALCKQCRACFLDLEGNTCLVVGEVFIVKRSLPVRALDRSTPVSDQNGRADSSGKFPPARAEDTSRRSGRMRACGD